MRLGAWAGMVAVLLGSAALADAPRLVRSEPADGSKGAAVNVGAVRFVFDRDMKQGQWTLAVSPKGEFPPMAAEGSARWLDARTFVLPVAELNPGVTYALQLNSESRQGFRAADGSPLPVTTVVFTTAAGEAAPEAPSVKAPRADGEAVTAEALQGEWRHKGRSIEVMIRFGPGTRYERIDEASGGKKMFAGHFRVENGVLVAPGEDTEDGESRFQLKMEGPGRLTLTDSKGARLTVTRVASAPAAAAEDTPVPETTPAQLDLTGSWRHCGDGFEVVMTFGAGGEWSQTVQDKRGRKTALGRYAIEKGWLVVRPAETDETIQFRPRLKDANTLELTDESGKAKTFARVAQAAPAAPAAEAGAGASIVGEWLFRNEEMELRAVFNKDGTFASVSRTGEGTERSRGRYRLANGLLTLEPEGEEAERLQFRVRLVDANTLELTDEDGDGVQMVRQRGGASAPGAPGGEDRVTPAPQSKRNKSLADEAGE